jgi:tetratricopeptide (TPR) repeat protein/TolB-like protein
MDFTTQLRRSLTTILLAAATCLPSAFAQSGGRVVLVLPFENRSGNASLNWVGDSFPDTLNKRLNSAGFLTISRDDRAYALDHLGLPVGFRPTRATTIRIAQQLDANYVVVGSYNVQVVPGGGASNDRLAIQAQVLSVDELRLSAPLEDSAPLARLFDGENAIAWKVAHTIDPHFTVAEQTFLAAPGAVPLPAFEAYIRGTNAATPAERIARLLDAVKVQPDYAAALLALGKEQYANKDFTAAAATLAKVPQSNPLALEANFYLGLARFNSNKYADAETAFAFVATKLPLSEVLNNQAVSASRQGKDASDIFRRAVQADPNDEDFHYNLAVSLFRRGDTSGALREIDAAIKIKPSDNDAGQLRARLAIVPPGTRLTSNSETGGFQPVERIRRSYSEASFRQAAFQLQQLRDARLAMLSPEKRAEEYVAAGRDFLAQGLLPEAEQQFGSAIASDPNSFSAHAGLALVREQSNSPAEARREAESSISIKPNVPALLLLARLDMASNQLIPALGEVNRALALEPTNASVIALRLALQQRTQAAH